MKAPVERIFWEILKRFSLHLIFAALLVQAGAINAHAQSSTPRADNLVTDGPVRAIACTSTTTYIGGSFSFVGPYTGGGVPISAATAKPVPGFPIVNGTVHACVSDGKGGWFIGGDFTRVGGLERHAMAHILSSGAVDSAWKPVFDGWVYAMGLSGSKLYVGGSFDTVNGVARKNLAALDPVQGNPISWNPQVMGEVWALVISGSKVYIGGCFSEIGGKYRNSLGAVDASSGAVSDWNPYPVVKYYDGDYGWIYEDPWVHALCVSGSTVYVAGRFNEIAGQGRGSAAAIDAATGKALAWDPLGWGLDVVSALCISGSTVFIGHEYGLSAVDASTGRAASINVGDWAGSVDALKISGSTLYVGGSFTWVGSIERSRLAALDLASGKVTSWNPVALGRVKALAVSGDTVYAGGSFSGMSGTKRSHLASLDAKTGALTSWNPSANSFVESLAVSGSTVYAGGGFSAVGGQSRNHIAALDAITGAATGWNPDANEAVKTLAVAGSNVLAGGEFTRIGGQDRNHLAALDASIAKATAWDPNVNDSVITLKVSGSTLYVGGAFSYIGGQYRNGLAAIDLAAGKVAGWDPNPTGHGSSSERCINALAVSGSQVYVGGSFYNIGGQLRHGIALVDAVTGKALSWNPYPNPPAYPDTVIHALALAGSTSYVGGDFTYDQGSGDIYLFGGQRRNYLAALDAAANATLWNPDPFLIQGDKIRAMEIYGSKLYIGGDFTDIGGEGRAYFARYDITPAFKSRPVSQVVYPGRVASFSVQALTETTDLRYRWRKDGLLLTSGGRISGARSRTLVIQNVQPSDAGSYVCTLVNDVGYASAQAVTLTLKSAPNGVVDWSLYQ